MLEVRAVRAGYGGVTVLWDVDLAVGAGEIVALVGANGAGKTTLLRAVSGGLAPSAGQILLDGVDRAGLPPERVARLGVAHVPEGRRLFSGLSVKENLLVGAHHRGRVDLASDLERVFDLFPILAERARQVAGRLSGGEQQMCALGRALMGRPRLLLIDELSLGLAPRLVDELLARLPEIAGADTGIVLVDQDVEAALSVAARGYVLETGRMVAQGGGAELLADPRLREAYLGIGPTG
jgi:branched-chain amino acid transport system ATP-binding protein